MKKDSVLDVLREMSAFEDKYHAFLKSEKIRNVLLPPISFQSLPNMYIIKVICKNIKPESIIIKSFNHELSITASVNRPDNNVNQFTRIIDLPQTVNTDKITHTINEKGLIIKLPLKKSKPKTTNQILL